MTSVITPVDNLAGFTGVASLGYFLHILNSVGICDAERIMMIAEQQTDYLRGGRKTPAPILRKLEERWYRSIREKNEPDYGVYAGDEYLAEAWACWIVYSRKYLRELGRIHPHIIGGTPKGSTIVDLGNGLGLTTAAFKQAAPGCNVVGTNLRGTTQWQIASSLAATYNFKMFGDAAEISGSVSLVFASEYFEHFDDPLPHLDYVIESLAPERLLIANAFTADAIGHFDTYRSGDSIVDGKTMGKQFGQRMRALGYRKEATKMWNSRPAYWVRAA